MPGTSEINKILIELQEELEKVKTASELIEVAKNSNKKILNDTENVINETTKNATDIINKVSRKFEEFFDQTKQETTSILNNSKELHKLCSTSSKEIINKSKKLNDSANNLMKSSIDLHEKITKIDFPARLDKMDTELSGILTSIQNVFQRIESIERNIKDYIKTVNDRIIELHEKQSNKVKHSLWLNRILIIIALILSLISNIGNIKEVLTFLGI